MLYPYKALKIKGKRIDEHRLIMQKFLDRILHKDEVVHHKNGNKRDNRLENLEVQKRNIHSHNSMLGNKNCLGFIRETYKFKDGKYWCNNCKQYLSKNKFWPDNSRKYKVRIYCICCESSIKDNKRLRMNSNHQPSD